MSCKFKVGDKIIPLSESVFKNAQNKRERSSIMEGYYHEIRSTKEIIVEEVIKCDNGDYKLDVKIDGRISDYYHFADCFRLYVQNDIDDYRND